MEQKGGNKISQNPVKAYLQGVKDGEKKIKAEFIHQGINLAYGYMLLSMADANDRSDENKKPYFSKPQFAEFYQKFAKALQTRVNDCIEGEEGIDTFDIADLYCMHDKEIREYYGLPLKRYDGKDEAL